jgi:hypothetical protein
VDCKTFTSTGSLSAIKNGSEEAETVDDRWRIICTNRNGAAGAQPFVDAFETFAWTNFSICGPAKATSTHGGIGRRDHRAGYRRL